MFGLSLLRCNGRGTHISQKIIRAKNVRAPLHRTPVVHGAETAYLSMLHLSLRVADRRVAHLNPSRLRRHVTVLICGHQNDVTASSAATGAAVGIPASIEEKQKGVGKGKGRWFQRLYECLQCLVSHAFQKHRGARRRNKGANVGVFQTLQCLISRSTERYQKREEVYTVDTARGRHLKIYIAVQLSLSRNSRSRVFVSNCRQLACGG